MVVSVTTTPIPGLHYRMVPDAQGTATVSHERCGLAKVVGREDGVEEREVVSV